MLQTCAVAWCGLRIYAKHFYNKEPQAEYFYLSEIPVKPSQFEADFEEIHQIVMENYSLYQAKHLNMDSLYQTYITRVRQAQTTTDYGLAVQEYISALQCSHAISCFRTYTARQFPVLIQDSLYINKPNAYLAQHGFKDKDCIIAISKVPYKEWINQHEKYAESSTDAWRHLKSARYAFTSYADTLRDYTLLRKGDTLTISLPLKRRDYFSDEKEVTVETKVLHKIGRGLFIDHGSGVIIGETTVIGDNVTLYQGVTLGGTGKEQGKRHPTLEDNVMVSAGAKILGSFTIGENSKIGAGSVVLEEVPPNCTVVGVPGRIVKMDNKKVPRSDMDQIHLPDPVLSDIKRLQEENLRLHKELKRLVKEIRCVEKKGDYDEDL